MNKKASDKTPRAADESQAHSREAQPPFQDMADGRERSGPPERARGAWARRQKKRVHGSADAAVSAEKRGSVRLEFGSGPKEIRRRWAGQACAGIRDKEVQRYQLRVEH